ncbi:MAG: DUF3791 domain-containing protein, partial [Planctomycetaceae bacterium]|nr:DUF3791 domain-containing protein [Planctomycetaceae bacterium]
MRPDKIERTVIIPKPVWAVGFTFEQTLRDATLNVFSYVDFKVASAEIEKVIVNKNIKVIEFVLFCVEMYADRYSVSGVDVVLKFERAGV